MLIGIANQLGRIEEQLDKAIQGIRRLEQDHHNARLTYIEDGKTGFQQASAIKDKRRQEIALLNFIQDLNHGINSLNQVTTDPNRRNPRYNNDNVECL
jgi:hypothetical protein